MAMLIWMAVMSLGLWCHLGPSCCEGQCLGQCCWFSWGLWWSKTHVSTRDIEIIVC